jgi:D-lyxose ketol-isomerase
MLVYYPTRGDKGYPMKRSEINQIMRSAADFINAQGFVLPPFAHWTALDWANKGPEVSEIVETHLGWDITDFGKGNFKSTGLFLFTLRNGLPENLPGNHSKTYAEKIMVVEDQQVTPLHFHWNKMEDIINRGGGRLKIKLFNADADEELDQVQPVQVTLDGVRYIFKPGEVLTLEPGESITLPPRLYHTFWGEGRVLVGEVSQVNDDHSDNRFYESAGRFPNIEEDEPLLHLLVGDYARFYIPGKGL